VVLLAFTPAALQGFARVRLVEKAVLDQYVILDPSTGNLILLHISETD